MENSEERLMCELAEKESELRRLEERLMRSERNLKRILDATPYATMLVGKDRAIRYVNKMLLTITGYESADELIGKTCHEVLCPAERNKCPVLDLRQQVNMSERLAIKKDGSRISILKSVVLIDLEGEEMLLEAFVDISDRKKAEALVKEILEYVDEAFLIIDPEYRVLSANKAFCRQSKMPIEEIIGRHCYEVSHRFDRPCYMENEECSVKCAIETGIACSSVHIHEDSTGNVYHVETRAYPMKDASGRIVSAIETIIDVSEKKKLEDRLRQSQKMEAIGTLTGGIAHDFNNILTAIMGYGELLHDSMDEDDPLREYVDIIMVSGKRAAQLTQSLLAFSRKQIIHPEPIDLNKAINASGKILSRLIGEDIELGVVSSDEPLMVMADGIQIEQILMNLATNARDAMPEGGVLSIKAEAVEIDEKFIGTHGFGRSGAYGLISVSDTGEGIDEKTKEQIFEPFFTTKGVGRGTGLGLAVVYGIVKQHNGYINVYSEPGKGTTFKIYLPLIKARVEERAVERIVFPEGGMETLLIAEDDEAVRGLVRNVLEKSGYKVIEAGDGQEAVELFEEYGDKIDLLLIDIVMPKKDGVEVYKSIVPKKPGASVIFMSGYPVEVVTRKGIPEGCIIVSKPVSPTEILRKVRGVLDEKKHMGKT